MRFPADRTVSESLVNQSHAQAFIDTSRPSCIARRIVWRTGFASGDLATEFLLARENVLSTRPMRCGPDRHQPKGAGSFAPAICRASRHLSPRRDPFLPDDRRRRCK